MKPIQLVLYKIAQICNLNCTYCYVYNKGDESWKKRPRLAPLHISESLGDAINEYCYKHNMNSFSVELHGGEPTLLGPRRFLEHIRALRSQSAPIRLDIFMQTNGTLLNEQWMLALDAAGVTFSLSLDGPPEFADKSRIYRSGKGSTQTVLDKIVYLRKLDGRFDRLCHGALCVIPSDADGARYVDWFAELNFRGIDFLLPDGNFQKPPLDENGIHNLLGFLISAFDRWLELDKKAPSIRLFEYAIKTKAGKTNEIDAFGADISTMCVMESNGALGCHDVLRICGGEFSADEAFIDREGLIDYHKSSELSKIQELHADCTNCIHLKSCGGGYLPHRFDGKTFKNPSWYCSVLFEFFSHVEAQLLQRIPANAWRKIPVRFT
ncbi:radical SAM protein [Serratia plymuthica]|uniref:radical SAM protein n=1 Tax=Serratia plymuthica TaxID=82996 RepID=UPI0018E41EE1|nr:radical SAM protein [Serratia plymuthica]MBI6138830.1 radical SAM protein [Serratia plymuthica]